MNKTNEIQISPKKSNGTLKEPTTIWMVRNDDNLYVRAWRGLKSKWYGAAKQSHEGNIRIKGKEIAVRFEEEDDEKTNQAINDAYLKKYGKNQYSKTMIGPEQQKTTLKVLPRNDEE